MSLLDPKIGAWLISPDYQKDKEAYKFDNLVHKYLPNHPLSEAAKVNIYNTQHPPHSSPYFHKQEPAKDTTPARHRFCDDLQCVSMLMQEIFIILEREKLVPVFLNQEMRLPIILANMELEGISLSF